MRSECMGCLGRIPGVEEGSMEISDYRKYWNAAFSWADYLADEVREHVGLWNAVWERAKVPGWAREQAARLGVSGGCW